MKEKDEEQQQSPPPYVTMRTPSIHSPKHRMRVADEIHLNPAYLHNENYDTQSMEQEYIVRTKL